MGTNTGTALEKGLRMRGGCGVRAVGTNECVSTS